ncbi:MAG: hypothetical protein ABIK68_05260 [bacterium]
MRSNIANKSEIAVSANSRETAINTEQTLDTTMKVNIGDIANLEPRREDDSDELTGMEEASTIYYNGSLGTLNFNFNKAQPQHFAFLMGFGLGTVTTTAAGTGYLHTITPIEGDLDEYRSDPTFTIGGKVSDIMKRLFASFGIDSVNATFAEDDWVKISAQAKGTGKVTNNYVEESITEDDDSTTLTLAANAVEGATAAARVDSVHSIKVELTSGVWTDVAFSAVSDATPAIITITAPGSSITAVTYKVLYVPEEPAWCTFPARISETPMRVTQMSCVVGGKWSGSAFEGGHTISSIIKTLEYSLQKNLTPKFSPGAGGAYASRMLRDARVQTLKINREFRDVIMQNYIDQNETFGVHVLCEGSVYDSPHKYTVEYIFPKCGILSAPISVDGKRIAEAGDLKVLQDDTYGSVIVRVKNLVSAYAA